MTFKSPIIFESNSREHREEKGFKRFLYSKFISVVSVVCSFQVACMHDKLSLNSAPKQKINPYMQKHYYEHHYSKWNMQDMPVT